MEKLAIYAGSFNPFHYGHLNVLEKTMALFDDVVVMIGQNPTKGKNSDIESRAKHLKKHLNKTLDCDVVSFTGLLTDAMVEVAYSRNYSPHEIVLIRGLRNGYDLDAELVQYEFLKELNPHFNIVFIPCDKEFNHISSSALRALSKAGGDREISSCINIVFRKKLKGGSVRAGTYALCHVCGHGVRVWVTNFNGRIGWLVPILWHKQSLRRNKKATD